MQATLTTTAAMGRQRASEAKPRLSTRRTLRRLQIAIVNGSDHPWWRQFDATTSLALLPSREQDRLLGAGRVPTH